MRKIFQEREEESLLTTLVKIYSYLTENISLRTSEWTLGRSMIYFFGYLQLFKSFFYGDQLLPLWRDCFLLIELF